MEETVEKLEAMFDKAECDLDLIHRKLEDECSAHCEASDTDQVNPAQVLHRISDIKTEFKSIVEDAQEIQKAQQEAMMFFRDKLTSACTALMQLQMSSSLEAEKPAELEKLEEFLGISVPNIQTVNVESSSTTTDPCIPSTDESHHCTKAVHSSKKSKDPVEPSKLEVEVTPQSQRCSSDEFVEVTADEFESVSSLIRGRVKLTDVNQTYQILWQHFKDNPESQPLTPTDMHKMGLRVTGKTGDAKLKVLRALKLLNIAKNGNVKIL